MGTYLCAQQIDINVCLKKLNHYQERKAEYKKLRSLHQAVTPGKCQNLIYSTACTQKSTGSTHLPSLTHQPQYGSLAWVHFSQSEYLWQSCTGSRCTWRTKIRQTVRDLKKAQEDRNIVVQRRCLRQQTTWPCIIMIRAQLDFKKIHTEPESGNFPLDKVQIHTLFLLFFPLRYSLISLQSNTGHHCYNPESWASLTKIELFSSSSYVTSGNPHYSRHCRTETASTTLWIQETATAEKILSKG